MENSEILPGKNNFDFGWQFYQGEVKKAGQKNFLLQVQIIIKPLFCNLMVYTEKPGYLLMGKRPFIRLMVIPVFILILPNTLFIIQKTLLLFLLIMMWVPGSIQAPGFIVIPGLLKQ